MRSFKQFLYRRNIKDVQKWIKSMGFQDYSMLVSWCNAEDVSPPEEDKYFTVENLPPSTPVRKPLSSKPNLAKSPNSTVDESEEAWHVPAADRPRKTSAPIKKTKKKAAVTKRK